MLSITSVDVNIEDINEFFGPRMNKNWWKYDDQPDEEVVKKIVKIYGVTKKQKVMNKQLTIFTFGLAIESIKEFEGASL